ncbi:MAG: methyl-accepting chemotaxis protein [Pseudooceanicola sp.]
MNASTDPTSLRTLGMGKPKFRWFGNLKLVVKLPLIIMGLSMLMAVALTFTAYIDSKNIMNEQIEDKFRGVLQDRLGKVEALLNEAESDLLTQAENPTITAAMASFSLSWKAAGESARQTLQADYVRNNPNPVGQKDSLNSTGSGTQYDIVHSKYHPYLRAFLKAHGYYDIFLVDQTGNVVYSVFKEPDYATNLETGQWRDSDLAKAWRKSKDMSPRGVTVTDFNRYEPSNGDVAGFIATPLVGREGQRQGVLIFQMPIDRLNAISENIDGLGQSGHVFVIGDDFRMRSTAKIEGGPRVLDQVERLPVVEAALRGAKPHFETVTGLAGHEAQAMAARLEFEGLTWVVVVEQTVEELLTPLVTLRNTLGVQATGLAIAIGLIGAIVARGVSKPFVGIGTALSGMRDGDYDSEIPYRDRLDDVGDLSRNLDDLREKLAVGERARSEQDRRSAEQRAVVEQLSTSIAKLAEGDLTAGIENEFASDYELLRTGFNRAIQQLNETITSLLGATAEIDTNAREVENASNELSQKAIEQAASLEETAAAITELSASVKSTADAAGQADKVMNRAKEDAEVSGQEVNRAMTAMDRISTSSQKITQVTSVIEDLAFQTNLLALNAGVEAARAGEAGRGFAVVASEVRALAQRSSDAAKEINALIQESADNVVDGVELVEKAGKGFEKLMDDFEQVSESVSSIAAAAREQSVGLSEINTAVDQLDGVTQKNAAVATEVHSTGKMMVNEAAKLNRISAMFRVDKNSPAPRAQVASMDVPPKTAPPRKVAVNGAQPVMGANDVSGDVWAEF